MFKGFTKCSARIINNLAVLEAQRCGYKEVSPEHVVIALLKDSRGIAFKIIEQIVDPVHLQMLLEDFVSKMPTQNLQETQEAKREYKDIEKFCNLNVEVALSHRMQKCLYLAVEEARHLQADELDTFVLFIACCKEKNSKIAFLANGIGISFEDLHIYYHRFAEYIALYENNIKANRITTKDVTSQHNEIESNISTPEEEKNFSVSFDDYNKSLGNIEEKNIKLNKKLLEKKNKKKSTEKEFSSFVIDLTEKMFHKKNELYGRDAEIAQIFRTLIRNQKNNPVLIGDPGVGKTALVEEMARRICWGEVPLSLLNARILQIDLALMTAGTRFRGDFEERLCKVLESVEKQSKPNAPIILFIDEFHHVIGAGLSSGTNMDAAGILKPALARGSISCIGATTVEEYQKYVETDRALARRISPINIEELSEESTFFALQTIKRSLRKNTLYLLKILH